MLVRPGIRASDRFAFVVKSNPLVLDTDAKLLPRLQLAGAQRRANLVGIRRAVRRAMEAHLGTDTRANGSAMLGTIDGRSHFDLAVR